MTEIFFPLIRSQNGSTLPMMSPLGRDGASLVVGEHVAESLPSGAVVLAAVVEAGGLVVLGEMLVLLRGGSVDDDESGPDEPPDDNGGAAVMLAPLGEAVGTVEAPEALELAAG